MRQNRMMHLVCFVILAALLSGCTAKTVVNRVQQNPSKKSEMNGVFYALPRTVIQVDVPVTKKVQSPGKFQKYALCFFPGETNIKDPKVTINIGEPKFTSRGEPDPKEIFLIKVPGNYFEDKTLFMDLTAEGVMTKGESTSTNHGLEIATNAIKTFVPILSSLAFSNVKTMREKADALGEDLLTPEQEACLCIAQGGNECNDRINRARQEKHYSTDDLLGIPGDLDEAIKAYRVFLAWQVERDKFITGAEATALPAETFKLMLAEIDSRIKSIKNLFLGTTTEQTWIGTFEFAPEKNLLSKKLFDYIEDQGVCTRDYAGLKPLDEKVKNPVNCTDSLKRSVMLRVTMGRFGQSGRQFSEQVSAANFKQSGDRGFYYRIPAMTDARVSVEPYVSLASANANAEKDAKGHDNILIAQLGETVSLPSSTNGRTTKYSLTLDAASGAMRNFVLGSEALIQNSEVSDIGTAVNSIVDARNKRKEAEASASDELNQLERKRKILEEMIKIKEAEEKLGTPKP